MLLSKWNEEERRTLAGFFTHPGWQLLSQEFRLRQESFKKALVYSADRKNDDICRAGIIAIDQILKVDKELFAPPDPVESGPPFEIPRVGNRYA